MRSYSDQLFQYNDSGFFIQRLVIIAAFGRLDAAGTAVLAGTFGNGQVGLFPEFLDQFIAFLGDADTAGMSVIDKDLGFAGIRMEGCETPPISLRSQRAKSGRIEIAACSTA